MKERGPKSREVRNFPREEWQTQVLLKYMEMGVTAGLGRRELVVTL